MRPPKPASEVRARRARHVVLLLLAGIGAPAMAQTAEAGAVAAPRELDAAQRARLKSTINGNAVSRDKAVADALARQRAVVRAQEEQAAQQAAAAAAAAEMAAVEAEPEVVTPSGPAAILNAFTTSFASEYAKNRQVVEEGNARVAISRQRMLDEQRERERQAAFERERQRQQELQRQRAADAQRAAAARPAGGDGAAQAARQAREAEMREQAALERRRLQAEAQAGAAAAPTASTAVSAAASTAVSAGGRPAAAASPQAGAERAHGPALAWCQTNKVGSFQCMGPLQRMLSWEKSLSYALELVGCSNGQGHAPTPDQGGSGFNCGRSLRVGEYRMPDYDPFRGGGVPKKVTAGD